MVEPPACKEAPQTSGPVLPALRPGECGAVATPAAGETGRRDLCCVCRCLRERGTDAASGTRGHQLLFDPARSGGVHSLGPGMKVDQKGSSWEKHGGA